LNDWWKYMKMEQKILDHTVENDESEVIQVEQVVIKNGSHRKIGEKVQVKRQ
jgi:hypothetical protein